MREPGVASVTTEPGRTPAHLILTIDYELFGDGSGCVERCVVDPARRMLAVAERHGAKLTFFVEALEFEAMERAGGDAAAQARRARAQLIAAARRGHDLQLHLHPQWLCARPEPSSRWSLDVGRWRLGSLSATDLDAALRRGLTWLGELRTEAGLSPQPLAFRAGGWCIQPSAAPLAALRGHGFRVESSVAPGLRNLAPDWYDFRGAPAELGAWPVDDEVCSPAPAGALLEVPIATGHIRWTGRLSGEIARRLGPDGSLAPGCKGSYAGPGAGTGRLMGKLSRLRGASTVMLDLCALSSSLLTRVAGAWATRRMVPAGPVPLVAIAHTKNFSLRAEEATDAFLAGVAASRAYVLSTFERWLQERRGGPRP